MIRDYFALKKAGIMGLNQRNLDMVLGQNHRMYIALADDKLNTKRMAQEHQVRVPELFATVDYQAQTANLAEILAPYNDFVIKPNRGSGGKGIVIITDTVKGKYRKPSGAIITLEQLQRHVSNTLSGVYSLGGEADSALIEYRVKADSVFDPICFHGVPDIRIVVYHGFPIMAMARLPTIQSDGKANLHQGAVGVGINIGTGVTSHGVMGNDMIDEHPDTLNPIKNIHIEAWDEILQIAASSYELTQLGYFGVDLVIDAVHGPMILEYNARPGLNIQIANADGLWRRITALLQARGSQDYTVGQRIALAKHLFS